MNVLVSLLEARLVCGCSEPDPPKSVAARTCRIGAAIRILHRTNLAFLSNQADFAISSNSFMAEILQMCAI